MNFTITQIERLQTTGKIRGYKVTSSTNKPVKPGKYKNIRCEYDGIKFDSAKEKDRYIMLRILEKQGFITDLKLQVPYLLIDVPNAKYRLSYEADFTYMQDGVPICEDVKPMDKRTGKYILSPLFKRKAKLMERVFGVTIKIV